MEAIGRPNLREGNCDYSGVCQLHFLPDDFSEDSHLKQRQRLKREAVPSVFGHKAQERNLRPTSLATPTARRHQNQQALAVQAEAFLLTDRITGLEQLEERLQSERIPSGFRQV